MKNLAVILALFGANAIHLNLENDDTYDDALLSEMAQEDDSLIETSEGKKKNKEGKDIFAVKPNMPKSCLRRHRTTACCYKSLEPKGVKKPYKRFAVPVDGKEVCYTSYSGIPHTSQSQMVPCAKKPDTTGIDACKGKDTELCKQIRE